MKLPQMSTLAAGVITKSSLSRVSLTEKSLTPIEISLKFITFSQLLPAADRSGA